MKLQELINYLEIAKEKLGAEAEVYVYNSYGDEDQEIDDIVMKAEKSLMDDDSIDGEDSKLQICI